MACSSKTINGVAYSIMVHDPESLAGWISSIDRESEVPPIRIGAYQNIYREVFRYAYFYDDETKTYAVTLVCQQMAMTLFSHLIKAPGAKIVWRIKPEFDVSHDTIPSDLSQVMNRKQIDEMLQMRSPVSLDEVKKALNKEDWASDFCTDTIFPVAAPKGHWRIFKSYMRYAVILGSDAIPHQFEVK